MPGIPITQVRQAMNTTATRGTPLIPVPRAMDHQATWDTRLTQVRRAMNTTATRGTPLIPVPQAMDHQATSDTRLTPARRATDTTATQGTPLIPVRRAMDHMARDTRLTLARRATKIRAIRLILPRLVPVLDIPSMAIPAIMLQRVGRLGPSTRSNLLAEVRTKFFRRRFSVASTPP